VIKYLTSAALAVVLLAGATTASADATNSTVPADPHQGHDHSGQNTGGPGTSGGHGNNTGGQTNTGGHNTTTTGGPNGGQSTTGGNTSTTGGQTQSGSNPGTGGSPNGQTYTGGNPNAPPYGNYNPNHGNNTGGNPNTGNPNTGNPNTGNPNTGNPNAGYPNSGNPYTGNPNDGHHDRTHNGDNNYNGNNNYNGYNGNNNYNGNNYNGGTHDRRPPGVDRPGFGHPPRGRDVGRTPYNPNLFPPQFRVTRRFHIAPYHPPRGWYSRQWGLGDFLPFGWFTSTYYLNWAAYGLPPPPFGCEWVREGDDALLVDVWSGEVLSVYENIFW
jgi:Ni/Co efflux regulator RcnB